MHTQNLNFVRPYPVGSGWLSWTFSPQHKLTFRNNLSVNHPSYIQICWYERHGNYLTQIFRGKEDLKSTHTFALGLEYEFKYKRFLSTTKLSYSSRMDEVDQTYTREVIEDRNYQVFTWVNASDSHIYGATEILGWLFWPLAACWIYILFLFEDLPLLLSIFTGAPGFGGRHLLSECIKLLVNNV